MKSAQRMADRRAEREKMAASLKKEMKEKYSKAGEQEAPSAAKPGFSAAGLVSGVSPFVRNLRPHAVASLVSTCF